MRHSTAAALLTEVRIWRETPSNFSCRTITTLTLAAALLGACSIATPPVISTQGGQLSADQTVSLATPAEDTRAVELHAALAEAFVNRGYSLKDAADHAIEYSITERPASIGIAHEDTGDATSDPVIVSADRQDRSILRECNAKRLRIVLVAYPMKSDSGIKRAVGEIDDCGFTAETVDALVMAMVEQIASE